MTLIPNLTTIASGDSDDPTRDMSNWNAIRNVVNGNLDNTNIASGADIDGSKIGFDSDSFVTTADVKPKMIGARASLGAGAQTINDDTWTTLQLQDDQTKCYDTGDDFSNSTYKFTCPVSGYYMLNANVLILSTNLTADKQFGGRIVYNSDVVASLTYTHSAVSSKTIGMSLNTSFYFSANDTVYLQALSDATTGSDTIIAIPSFLCVTLIAKD